VWRGETKGVSADIARIKLPHVAGYLASSQHSPALPPHTGQVAAGFHFPNAPRTSRSTPPQAGDRRRRSLPR